MKIKTSITLSEETLKEVDKLSSRYGNRSILIEQAIREFLVAGEKRRRDLQDIEILNRRADVLNKEVEDVLSYLDWIPLLEFVLPVAGRNQADKKPSGKYDVVLQSPGKG